ncbi:hypothetical protein GYA25_02600 [Candidatus Woesearchaeota archaeon]|jgi:uncharacterized membrane-anchored protein|nr:hypothetical protein [Candidatus Woesearchaeota archaeon]
MNKIINKELEKTSSKKKFLNIFLSLFFVFSLKFISSETLSEILASIEPSLVILTSLFIIIFALTYFSLNKYFKKENQSISGIIALAVSLLVIYAVNRADIITNTNFFYTIGISESSAGWIFFLISAAILAFIITKFKIDSLWIIGVLLMGTSLFVYEKDILFIIGALLIIVRFFFKKKKKEED